MTELGRCAAEVVKETLRVRLDRRGRHYVFIPDAVKEKAPVPLIVLLHGSGRNGKTQTDRWEPLARKEGFIIVAPDVAHTRGVADTGGRSRFSV